MTACGRAMPPSGTRGCRTEPGGTWREGGRRTAEARLHSKQKPVRHCRGAARTPLPCCCACLLPTHHALYFQVRKHCAFGGAFGNPCPRLAGHAEANLSPAAALERQPLALLLAAVVACSAGHGGGSRTMNNAVAKWSGSACSEHGGGSEWRR